MSRQYLINGDEAVCKDCGLECSPVFHNNEFDYEYGGIKGRHTYGDEWLSDCCDAEMLNICGGEWVAEFEEAN